MGHAAVTHTIEDPRPESPGPAAQPLLDRLSDRLLAWANAAGTLLIVALGLLVNADVFGRALFNAPIVGVPELAGLAIVAIVFLQVPYCLRHAHLTRSEAFLDKLFLRRPAAAVSLDLAFHLIGAAVFAVIAWAGWGLTAKAFSGGEYEGAQGVLMIPVWPVKLIVCLGALTMALQYLRLAWARAVALRRHDYAGMSSFAAGEEL
jgi:TRAP-type C4-dicarboxylate transport system permease small subunit